MISRGVGGFLAFSSLIFRAFTDIPCVVCLFVCLLALQLLRANCTILRCMDYDSCTYLCIELELLEKTQPPLGVDVLVTSSWDNRLHTLPYPRQLFDSLVHDARVRCFSSLHFCYWVYMLSALFYISTYMDACWGIYAR